jgi:hypothetical protein
MGFAAGNGLNSSDSRNRPPFVLATWAADPEDDVEDINGRNRDYLLLVLLYFPCTAALAAVYRETNMGWALFIAGWTTGMASIVSIIGYRLRRPSCN